MTTWRASRSSAPGRRRAAPRGTACERARRCASPHRGRRGPAPGPADAHRSERTRTCRRSCPAAADGCSSDCSTRSGDRRRCPTTRRRSAGSRARFDQAGVGKKRLCFTCASYRRPRLSACFGGPALGYGHWGNPVDTLPVMTAIIAPPSQSSQPRSIEDNHQASGRVVGDGAGTVGTTRRSAPRLRRNKCCRASRSRRRNRRAASAHCSAAARGDPAGARQRRRAIALECPVDRQGIDAAHDRDRRDRHF